MTACADLEKVRQVLLDVLTNAVKFMPLSGHVSLAYETDRAADVVQLSDTDTGRGIPPDQLDRTIEPFVQLDRHLMHERQQDIGLGLAIGRDLARAKHDDFVAHGDGVKGSTFVLTLSCG